MKRRILALLLALVMAVGLALPASAEGLDGGSTGEPVVITGEGTDTTTPTEGEETPAAPTTPTEGEETPAAPTTPTEGGETPTPPTTGESAPTPDGETPATPVDGEDEDDDESGTPAPLGMAAPMSVDAVSATPTTKSVEYVDENGDIKTVTATKIENDNTSGSQIDGYNYKSWTTGWYYVEGESSLGGNEVSVSGDVKLILCDDAKLNVVGWSIELGSGASLTIYGQSKQTGTLEAVITTKGNAALTINGGVVEAKGKKIESGGQSYGISSYTGSLNMTVNGGEVIATGGDIYSGAGVSYGIYFKSGSLTVNGGTVTATGGTVSNIPTNKSYGINLESDSKVIFNGGTLIAKAGSTGNTRKAFSTAPNLSGSATYYWRNSATGDYKTNAETVVTTGDYVELTTQPSGDGYIPYINWNGTRLVAAAIETSSATEVDNSTTDVTWDGGTAESPKWYVVKGNVTITGNVTVTGHVNLILCDGAKLTVNGKIQVGNNGNQNSSLTIYAQSTGTGAGTLTVNGGSETTVGIDVYRSSLTINGGNINATGGTGTNGSHGISIDYTSSMTVNSGKVTATGQNSDYDSIGINLIDGGDNNPTLTINGGEVTATGNTAGNSFGSYGIKNVTTGTVTIAGGRLTADGKSHGIKNYGAVNITGGEVIAKQAADSSGKAVYLDASATLTLPTAYWWRTEDTEGTTYKTQNKYSGEALTGKYFEVTTTKPQNVNADTPVSYLDWDDKEKALKSATCTDYILVKDSSNVTWGAENTTTYYVVDKDVTIDGTVTAYGDVHLILCDNATLEVKKGVVVEDTTPAEGDKSALTIYGQSGQSGKLEAKGSANGGFSAGINIDSYGDLTINGGEVEATGGSNAEGQSVTTSYGIYGTYIVINNGTVEATGGDTVSTSDSNAYSGGISIWEMTVNGGEVTATGGKVVATSGGNAYSDGINIWGMTINGGEVTATGGNAEATDNKGYAYSYGICAGNAVDVYGGVVNATGGGAKAEGKYSGAYSYGICVYSYDDYGYYGELTIEGGTVTAEGGKVEVTKKAEATDEDGYYYDFAVSYGIYVGKDMTVEGKRTTVNAYGGTANGYHASSFGIYTGTETTSGNITFENAKIIAEGKAANGAYTAYSYGISAYYGYLTITNANITATGGTAKVENTSGSEAKSYGIFVDENMTVEGESTTVNATGGKASSGGDAVSHGICVAKNLTVNDGEVEATGDTATATGKETYAYSYGIEVYDDLSINGRVVKAYGGNAKATGEDAYAYSYGIYVNGYYDDDDDDHVNLTIKSGNVTATGGTATAGDVAYSYGIYVYGYDGEKYYGNMTIESGTVIAETTATGSDVEKAAVYCGKTCKLPAAYWWRIVKTGVYSQFPSTAYVYNGTDTYVEITTEGEGLPLLPDSDPTTTHKHTRRQNTTAADLLPAIPEKTDVTSPETFDAGIAVYVGLGVLSLTGSAAWLGKRRK